MRILFIFAFLRSLFLVQVGVANAERNLPADLQFDLIFPRNETYAPTQFFPIVLGIQNLDAVWPVETDFLTNIQPVQENTTFKSWQNAYLGLYDPRIAEIVSSAPLRRHYLIQNSAINMTNATEGQFLVTWEVKLWRQCHIATDGHTVIARPFHASGVVMFSTRHGAQVPDVAATINACPEPNNMTSTVLRITDVLNAPSDDSLCPVFDNVTETTPVKCGYKDLADEISANLSSFMLKEMR